MFWKRRRIDNEMPEEDPKKGRKWKISFQALLQLMYHCDLKLFIDAIDAIGLIIFLSKPLY